MPKHGILIADYTLWRALCFVQSVDHVRPDVQLVFVEGIMPQGVANWIAAQNCKRPVFLATDNPANYYQLDQVRARYKVEPADSIFKVDRSCPAG